MVNKVILIGNLGKDPEFKELENTSVANFSIATSEKYKDKEYTEWHNLVAWGKLASVCNQYLKKGDKIYAEGRIKTDTYEKDGVKRYATKINIDKMVMLGGGKSNQVGNQADDQADDLPF